MSSSRSRSLLELLRRLEQLKNEGILSEEEYKIRREKLINALLLEEEHETFLGGGEKKPQRPTLFMVAIVVLVLVLIFLGIAGYFLYSLWSAGMNPATTVYTPEHYIITQTVYYAVTQTVTQSPPEYYYHTSATIQPQYSAPARVWTVYSGSLTIDRDCSSRTFDIQASKGDVIRVYWEADDRDTYVAIGSGADLEKLRQYYCEVMMSFWKWSWPAAGSGYSGSLEFRVPSSGTWHVIVANGNWECIFSDCPVTVTVLEIKHESS